MRAILLGLAVAGFFSTPNDTRALEIKCGVEITNKGPQDVYCYIDNTGRLGKGVKADKVAGPDGKPLPPGLIIAATKGPRSFGEAIGFGTDWPTVHLWLVANGKTVSDKETASLKVSSTSELEKLLKGENPKLEFVWDGKELTLKE